jgi:hypothetical protein
MRHHHQERLSSKGGARQAPFHHLEEKNEQGPLVSLDGFRAGQGTQPFPQQAASAMCPLRKWLILFEEFRPTNYKAGTIYWGYFPEPVKLINID